MNVAQKQARVRDLYNLVLQTANKFLHNAKHFKIEILQEEDPTYEQLAEVIDQACKIITSLSEDVNDPLTGQKAYEYCSLMKAMAVAIKNSDETKLDEIVKDLDRRSFL